MYTTYVRTQCRILCPISSDRVLPRVVLHDRTMDINRNRWNCYEKYMSERIFAKTITKLSNATAAKKIDMDYSTLGRKWNACSNQSHKKQFVEWSVEHLVFWLWMTASREIQFGVLFTRFEGCLTTKRTVQRASNAEISSVRIVKIGCTIHWFSGWNECKVNVN